MVAAVVRLAKYLAHAGVASRRAAEQLVFAGRVTRRRRGRPRPGARRRRQRARRRRRRAGRASRPATRAVYAINKPRGVVSTARDPHGRPTVVELVPSSRRLYPVGRLDADTTGLILLTDDGDARPPPHAPVASRSRAPTAPRSGSAAGARRALRALREGVELDDGRTAPARVRRLAPDALELTIHEGRKRQVRRMSRPSATRSSRSSACASARCGSATLAEGRAPAADGRRGRAAAPRRAQR